jgi:hypothetical protein
MDSRILHVALHTVLDFELTLWSPHYFFDDI